MLELENFYLNYLHSSIHVCGTGSKIWKLKTKLFCLDEMVLNATFFKNLYSSFSSGWPKSLNEKIAIKNENSRTKSYFSSWQWWVLPTIQIFSWKKLGYSRASRTKQGLSDDRLTSSSYGGLVGEDQLLGHDLKVVQLESIYGRAESFLDLFDLPLTFALMKFLSSRFFSKVLRRLRWSIFFLRQSSVQSHSEDSNLERPYACRPSNRHAWAQK